MTLFGLFAWCERTPIAEAMRASVWAFPVVLVGHLLALALLGGTLLIVDLRLLGWPLASRSAADLARDVHRWLLGALAASVATGLPLFLSEATRCYETPPFWAKVGCFVAASTFTFTIRRRVLARPDASRRLARVTGATSIALWFGVALMGRFMGFW